MRSSSVQLDPAYDRDHHRAIHLGEPLGDEFITIAQADRDIGVEKEAHASQALAFRQRLLFADLDLS